MSCITSKSLLLGHLITLSTLVIKFSFSNRKSFKHIGMTDVEMCPNDSMFNCNCTCSTYEFACQTVLIACIIESNCKYNCTNCLAWNTSFSNTCVISPNQNMPDYQLIYSKHIYFPVAYFSTLVILITEILSSTTWAFSSWLLANLLTLELVVFKSDSVAVPNK